MRYLVTARVKPGKEQELIRALESGSLGRGSVAGGEYLRNMESARVGGDGKIRWVEVCFCATPLEEERPYWEEYFELIRVQDAHHREHCKDSSGTEAWACSNCDCSQQLEEHLARTGDAFLKLLKEAASDAPVLKEE